jgi:hypothetical protein
VAISAHSKRKPLQEKPRSFPPGLCQLLIRRTELPVALARISKLNVWDTLKSGLQLVIPWAPHSPAAADLRREDLGGPAGVSTRAAGPRVATGKLKVRVC